MNLLAYFIYHTTGAATPILWLINIVIYVIIAVIIWMIVKWAASEFGVPPQIVKIVGLLIFLLLVLSLFVGCATDSGNVAADRRGRITNAVLEETFNSVLNFGLNRGAAYISGQNGQDAAQAAFQAAQSGILSSGGIQHIVAAAAGPVVAQKAAASFAAANPQTPAEAEMVSNTIGAALQQAANQLAK